MAKNKKRGVRKPIPKKTTSFKQVTSKSQQLANDLYKFRVQVSHDLIEMKKAIYELRREATNFSMYFSALLDLFADVSGVPGKALTERFIQYCGDKQVVDQYGRVRGSLHVTKYNFSE